MRNFDIYINTKKLKIYYKTDASNSEIWNEWKMKLDVRMSFAYLMLTFKLKWCLWSILLLRSPIFRQSALEKKFKYKNGGISATLLYFAFRQLIALLCDI